MKKLFVNTVANLLGFKIHASHTAIKGKKSSGERDSHINWGSDWKN